MDNQLHLKKIDHVSDGPYNTDCIACTAPEYDKYILGISDYWKIVLHPWQAHIGSCLVTLGRHAGKLSLLSKDEQIDFFKMLELLERSLKAAFGIEVLNIQLLMNWSYREKNPEPGFLNGRPNPHIHWHLITRYKKPIGFAGEVFTDPNYGDPYDGTRKPKLSTETKDAIFSKLQENIFSLNLSN